MGCNASVLQEEELKTLEDTGTQHSITKEKLVLEKDCSAICDRFHELSRKLAEAKIEHCAEIGNITALT